MSFSKTASGLALGLAIVLLAECSSGTPEKSEQSLKPMPNWPPKIIYNTDGAWAFNYLHRRDPKDLLIVLDALEGKGVDVVSVLVGIDDDLSWRGSSHGSMWGENVQNWDPDKDTTRDSVGGMKMSDVELLHQNLAAIQDDGHDLMKILVERAHELKMGIFASFRMNDAHVSYEDRGWYGRSKMKLERTDLLIGSTVERFSAGRADEWNFAWQWDFAHQEVRDRFLGLFDEALTRYDFDGLELDFSRQPNYFKSGEAYKHVSAMTEFIGKAQAIVHRHQAEKGRETKLTVRVPPSIDHSITMGLDSETWIRQGLIDAVVLSSVGYCDQRIDIERAVEAAKDSSVLIYTGCDTRTHRSSPYNGFEGSPATIPRAAALNGYRQGAAGFHLFNYDYRSHRPNPVPQGEPLSAETPINTWVGHFTSADLEAFTELASEEALASLDRCYYAASRELNHLGDYPPQVPYKLSTIGRGAGPANAIQIRVNDDIAGGLADGRIKKTELRLRLTDTQKSFNRIRCDVNGTQVDLSSGTTIKNSKGDTWLVLDNPPVKNGINTILLALEGMKTPAEYTGRGGPWPTLHSCEIIVKCED